MAQSLSALFGSAGATRFLQLLARADRHPCWELTALEEDGATVRLDLTELLLSWSAAPTDEMQSVSASYSVKNEAGRFDRYAGGPDADVLREGRILRFRKGLVDPVDGTRYLVPAHYGRVVQGEPTYSPSAGSTISVTAFDELKNPVRQRITSGAYENTEANLIASDLLQRFARVPPARIALAALSRKYFFAQFPDMTLADALKLLFDPVLFWVRPDEAGVWRSGPRLGSGRSSLANVKGYPDQLAAPAGAAVTYTFPDSPGVEMLAPSWQDFDGVYNQVRVMGRSEATRQTLGPVKRLFVQQDSSVNSRDTQTIRVPFGDPQGTENVLLARNAYVVLQHASSEGFLDEEPRTDVLSLMVWRAAWSADAEYRVGDAVSFSGGSYACSAPAKGAGQSPASPEYWQPIDVEGPFARELTIQNEDPRDIGFVRLQTVNDQYLVLRIEGREYSRGGPVSVRHRGGFFYRFEVKGQPVLSFSRTLTAYADYDPQPVEDEPLADVFGDHRTYQAPHAPLAMSVPVEVFVDGLSKGKIAADQSDLSGQTEFAVDFERGRIVLSSLAYQNFSADTASDNPFSTGGTAQTTAETFELDQLEAPAPQAIFQTYRQGNSVFTFSGLVVGQGYEVRLSFGDPTSTEEKQRLFSVYANGAKVIEALDISARTGGAARVAYQQTLTGVAPDATGKIVLRFTQNDPDSGTLLPECSANGDGTGGAVGSALVSAIEILLPQGQGAPPAAVNCGGPAINPPAPAVTATYAYSPVQQANGVQSWEVNDPLLASDEECAEVAAYYVNFFAWGRHRQRLKANSVPHLQPGDLIKAYNPLTGCDLFIYVRQISRSMTPGASDSDELTGFLIFAQKRP